jgi:ATP-binding cassette subfamily B protein
VSSPANSSAGSWREGRPGGAAEAKPAGEDRPVFGRIVAEVAPHRWAIFGLFLLSLLATPLSLLGPVPLKIAVDSALGAEPLPALIEPLVPEWLEASSLRLLVFCAVLQVLVALLAGLQTLTSSVSKTILGERISLGFRARLLRHVQRLSFAFHDVRGTADSIYRIQYDAPAIQQVAVQAVLPLISSGLTFFFLLYVMVRLDWQLALIGVAISPLLYLSTRSFRKRTRPGYRRAKRLESGALGIVHEVLSAFRVVKAFGREAHESERFVDHSSRGIRARVRLAVAENAFDLFVKVTTAAGTAAVLFVGVRNVQAGVLTLGELLMVLAYIAQLYTPLQSPARLCPARRGSRRGRAAERAPARTGWGRPRLRRSLLRLPTRRPGATGRLLRRSSRGPARNLRADGRRKDHAGESAGTLLRPERWNDLPRRGRSARLQAR